MRTDAQQAYALDVGGANIAEKTNDVSMPNALRLIHREMQPQSPHKQDQWSGGRKVWRSSHLGGTCPKPQAEAAFGIPTQDWHACPLGRWDTPAPMSAMTGGWVQGRPARG